MNFKVQSNYVVVKLPEIEEVTKGGIYKPQAAKDREKAERSSEQKYVEVLQAGPKCVIVKEGDFVFTTAPIMAYNMEGEEFGLVNEDFIVGVKN